MPRTTSKPGLHKRRVLLVSSPTLFGESLELLLQAAGDIEVIGPMALDSNTCDTVLQAAPDVVVLADDRPDNADLITLTAVLMERFPTLRVIKTGLEQTTLRVFAAETWPASRFDLISAIRENETHGG